jgi:hypothetical protein
MLIFLSAVDQLLPTLPTPTNLGLVCEILLAFGLSCGLFLGCLGQLERLNSVYGLGRGNGFDLTCGVAGLKNLDGPWQALFERTGTFMLVVDG